MERLLNGAAALGLTLTPAQLALFERYYERLVDGNRRVNLTRVTAYDDVQVRHFLDSLSTWLATHDLLDRQRTLNVIDVGAGAGFPGLPLKIVFPELRLTLLDSLHKRTAFLARLVESLGLDDVQVCTARAEDAARLSEHRQRYDVALARALAPLPVLLELCLPFLRVGGRLVALRRGELASEIADAGPVLKLLGAGRARIIPVDLPGLRDGRALVVVEQLHTVPPLYPRRAGIPERHPLGTRS